jgi:hypothetical protein
MGKGGKSDVIRLQFGKKNSEEFGNASGRGGGRG